MPPRNLITENDLITWLSLKNKRQLRSLREKGMPHLKLNGHEIRYNPEEIEQWMAKNAERKSTMARTNRVTHTIRAYGKMP